MERAPSFGSAVSVVVAILLVAVLAAPASAQDPSALLGGETETTAGAPQGVLAAVVDPAADEEIARALRRRYAEIEGLEHVEVAVEAGVVTLGGEALTLAAIDRAADIARRTEGVAEVDERIATVTDVRERVTPTLEKARDRLVELISLTPLLLVAFVLVLVAARIGRWVAARDRLFERLAGTEFVRDLLRQLVRIAFLIAGVLVALDILGATALVGAVLGTAGVFGLAIGFAFKDLVENYIASVLLSLRQPFAPNDFVEIDGRKGKVVRLTPRATILMTLDGNHLRIPNSQVFKAVILNYTRNPLRRFDFGVGVGVEEDLVEAQELGLGVLRAMDGVVGDPEPWSQIGELGDSNVLVRFYAWVDQERHNFVKVKSAAIRLVKTALEDAEIDLPEPIYRVHLLEAGQLAAPPRRRRPAETTTLAAVDDLSTDDSIDRQIAAERSRSDSKDDLLSDDAPSEMG
ncbi:MAG: mechanosensitive ion channel family protein [Acidobacteriota bacterium]